MLEKHREQFLLFSRTLKPARGNRLQRKRVGTLVCAIDDDVDWAHFVFDQLLRLTVGRNRSWRCASEFHQKSRGYRECIQLRSPELAAFARLELNNAVSAIVRLRLHAAVNQKPRFR